LEKQKQQKQKEEEGIGGRRNNNSRRPVGLSVNTNVGGNTRGTTYDFEDTGDYYEEKNGRSSNSNNNNRPSSSKSRRSNNKMSQKGRKGEGSDDQLPTRFSFERLVGC